MENGQTGLHRAHVVWFVVEEIKLEQEIVPIHCLLMVAKTVVQVTLTLQYKFATILRVRKVVVVDNLFELDSSFTITYNS